MPLPDGLLDRLKASNWSERDEGVSELEEFVSAYPRALAPHLHKVSVCVYVCVRACMHAFMHLCCCSLDFGCVIDLVIKLAVLLHMILLLYSLGV